MEHKNKRQKADKDWFTKAAEECDILLSGDSDDEATSYADNKHFNQVQKLKSQLQALLAKQLIPKGMSTNYLTSNPAANLAQIAMKEKGISM